MKVLDILKQRGLILYSRLRLTPPPMPVVPDAVPALVCQPGAVRVMTGTSNNVVKVTMEDRTGYFRECRRHTDPRTYLTDLLDEYYTEIAPEDGGDREYVISCLKGRRRFNRFFRMGMTNDRNARVWAFYENNDPEAIGLTASDAERLSRIRRMVQYVWGELFTYRLNGGVKKGHYQTYNAVRELATAEAARLIGLDGYIPKTTYVRLCPVGGRERFGTWMEAAPGCLMKREPVERRRAVTSPALQHALNNLNALDVICHERDHKPSNYHVILNPATDKAEGICAFDNDSPMCFGTGRVTFATYMQCSPWVNRQTGTVNRPYMDKALAEAILALNERDLGPAFAPYLNPCEIRMLMRRVSAVKKAVARSIGRRPGFLLEDGEWTEETVRAEMDGAAVYGKTYLTLFNGELKLPHQPWITAED